MVTYASITLETEEGNTQENIRRAYNRTKSCVFQKLLSKVMFCLSHFNPKKKVGQTEMATHTLKKKSWYVFNCYFNCYCQNQKYAITREPWPLWHQRKLSKTFEKDVIPFS